MTKDVSLFYAGKHLRTADFRVNWKLGILNGPWVGTNILAFRDLTL